MGFGEAVARCWSGWLDFNGRARRSEYWYWQLFLLLSGLGLFLAAAMIGRFLDSVGGGIVFVLFIPFVLAIIIPNVAVTVRQRHDIGMSGWGVLINLIPYIGGLIVLAMTVVPGTRGPNKYGPDSCAGPDDIANVF